MARQTQTNFPSMFKYQAQFVLAIEHMAMQLDSGLAS